MSNFLKHPVYKQTSQQIILHFFQSRIHESRLKLELHNKAKILLDPTDCFTHSNCQGILIK